MKTQLIDIEALIRDANELEPLPQSAIRLSGLLAQEDWDLQAVNEVVRYDEALTGRLLGAANSVRSGARAEINTVDQAVMRLGASQVLTLAVGATVRGRLERSLPVLGLDEGELWRHSVASALAMEHARPFLTRSIPPHAFVTALLHDVGKLVLERHLDGLAAASLRLARHEGELLDEESEVEVLQVSHAEIGGLITRAWELPECIAIGIQFHHQPLLAPDEEGRRLAMLVGLADGVAARIGAGDGGVDGEGGLSPALAGALGLGRDAFQELCERTARDLDRVLEQYAH